MLEKLGVDYEMTIISAHREPDVFFEYAKSAEEKGFKVIIAGAGMAAHLPVCVLLFSRCRLSVSRCIPLLWEAEIPCTRSYRCRPVSPVATVAINGGANAAILAAKILATSDDALLSRLKAYTQEMKEEVEAKDAKLKEVGYKNYTK